jgi:serine/threonine protein kinase
MSELRDDELLAQVTEVAGYKVLPPCVVYAKIGQGGMGAVYRGRHLNLDIDVAVKCLKPGLVKDDPQFVARFRREGQSAARINHQNVIRVFDVAEDQGLHYLIMEFVQGETARQRVDRKGPLAIGEALQILYESALGLGEAHRLGIVHRDIKPDNLLISSSGQVKVADLGLAKPTLGKDGGSKVSMLSSANQIMGTPSYMPPEQWDGAAVTAAADVWALGATLWFLLVGHEAIRDESPARIMSRIVLQPFPDVKAARKDVPDDVVAVLVKATAKEPGERYLDALEMADAIDALATRRASLRDRAAGTTELRTLLSPPPLKNLDEVKALLRDELRTRQSTPSRFGTPTPGSTPGANDGGTIVTPPRGGTAVQQQPGGTQVQQPPPGPAKSRAPLLVAAALLAAAGGGYVWWSGRTPEPKVEPRADQPTADQPTADQRTNGGDRTGKDKPAPDPKNDSGAPPKPPEKEPEKKVETPPPPPPFARADELELSNDLAGAIAETERVGDAAAQRERTQRLARLRGKRANALQAEGKLLAARDELRSALQLQDTPELQQQRQQLRTAMATAAEKALQRERPDATTPQPADREIEFAGVLQADFVQELRLGGEEVARKSDGSFRERRRVGADGSLAVAVRVDDEERALLPWRVTLAAPTPGLKFVGSFRLTKPRADGRLITADSTVSIDGKLSEPGGELLVDGQPVRAEWRSDGSFTVSVQVPKEGPSQLQFEARKDGRRTPVMEVEVVRPPKTQWEPVEPKTRNNNQIARTRTLLKVRMSNEYADTVVASCDGQKFELQRDPENPKVFAGEITLTFGQKRVEVVVTNLVGITSTDAFTFNCTARVPSLAIASLREGSDNRTVGRDPLFVRNLDARLLLQCDDPEAELLVDGEKVAATTPFGLDLRPFLSEGQARTLALRTRNENGSSDERKLTVTLDTVAPSVVAEPVTASAPGSTVVVGGTWRERTDGLSIVIEGVVASLVRKDADGGTWSAVLRAPATATKWRLVATDAAGNRSPEVVVDVPVAAAAVATDPDKDRVVTPVTPPVTPPVTSPTVTPKDLPGFSADGEQRTSAGYPLTIKHLGSGVRLVAIAVDANGKPALYAAVREVSEKQWDGTSADRAKTNITGEEIRTWLMNRGQGLELPTEADWSRLVAAASPELQNLREREGVFELLAPASYAASSWPLKKDPSTASHIVKRRAGGIGFRVVYRPK